MRRRDLIAGVAGLTVAWPFAVRAQQPATRVRRIAVLLRIAQDDPDAQRDLQVFRKGLWELGWTVGNNILIEYRYANADPAQIQTYAAELVGLPAEVVLAGGSFPVAALRRETRTTPIVFVRVADPVSQGFVASLAHPGANVTGFASIEYSYCVTKGLPRARRVIGAAQHGHRDRVLTRATNNRLRIVATEFGM
jgi:putative ABC transport system substrate-binding protein